MRNSEQPNLSRIPHVNPAAQFSAPTRFAWVHSTHLHHAYRIAVLLPEQCSGLGRSLVGLHHNEKRLRALGLTVWRAKATAFAISAPAGAAEPDPCP